MDISPAYLLATIFAAATFGAGLVLTASVALGAAINPYVAVALLLGGLVLLVTLWASA